MRAPNTTEPPTWELIYKRNSIERLKRDKPGLDVLAEIPAMIETGYEAVPEEDLVRLQWYGLYHDKPKTGRFMLRVKTPGGFLTPEKLRAIGRISRDLGGDYAELTTRQNIQLHDLELARLPEVLAELAALGLDTAGACGDNVRNVTGCPLAGLDAEELFDVRPILEETAAFFRARPEYSNLPRKHKITISACPHQCNAPEIHCIALIGTIRDGREGFAVRVGGGLSTFPRLASDLGVWMPKEQAVEVLAAIVDTWRLDLRYRMSRARARLKFLIEDVGVEAFRARVEERLGYRLENGPAVEPVEKADPLHAGLHPQRQPGLWYAGFPVPAGLISGTQLLGLADLAESFDGEIRLTRQQNFLLANIPDGRKADVVAAVAPLGFPLDVHAIHGRSMTCTGDPYCNFAVAETKRRLGTITDHLAARFGPAVADLAIHLDGCPHACAHHWTGDLGLQGTTLRERGPNGERRQGFDVFLRGAQGKDAAIGRPVLKRVPADQIHVVLERLIGAYLENRVSGERLQQWFARSDDADLIALSTLSPPSETPGPLDVAVPPSAVAAQTLEA
ncbi:MAG TPA: nitrite/sulfite reductase [Thermoanaerobaculia bacterium]|nr:nitrite/sulfite reductase [Thermoanaerobaculia bacterium]